MFSATIIAGEYDALIASANSPSKASTPEDPFEPPHGSLDAPIVYRELVGGGSYRVTASFDDDVSPDVCTALRRTTKQHLGFDFDPR